MWIIEGWNTNEGYVCEELKHEPMPAWESFGVDANSDSQSYWVLRLVDQMPDEVPENERMADFAYRFEQLTGINIYTSSIRAEKNLARREN